MAGSVSEREDATSDQELKVLLSDYSDARSDERTFQNLQLTLLAVCVALLSFLSTQIANLTLPSPIMACLPLAALAILGVFAMAGAQATVRSYYMRELEAKISDQLTSSFGETRSWITHGELMVGLTSLRLGRGYLAYKLILLIVFLATLAIFGGVTAQIALRLGPQYMAVMIVGYGAFLLALFGLVWQSTARGDRLYETIRSRVGGSRSTDSDSGLLKYLALPRLEDIQKIFLLPGFWIGFVLSANPNVHPIGIFIWCWVVIEFLAYQARYQWNDIRGLSKDISHPQANYRRRLPVGAGTVRRSVRASAWIIVARVFFAAVLAICAPAGMSEALLLGILGIFVVGGLYEWARSRAALVAVVLLVPLGYPLRFAVGLFAGGATFQDHWAVLALAVPLLYAWGMAFVGLTWSLEAADFRMRDEPPARHLEWFLENAVAASVAIKSPSRPLAGTMRKFSAINVATLVALLLVPPLGQTLFGRIDLGLVVVFETILVGGFSALCPIATPSRRLLVAGLVSAMTFGVGMWAHGSNWAPAFDTVVTGLILCVYCMFRAASYKELKSAPTEILKAVRRTALKVAKALVGSETFSAIRRDRATHDLGRRSPL